jgi:hypothetical protein
MDSFGSFRDVLEEGGYPITIWSHLLARSEFDVFKRGVYRITALSRIELD